MRIHAPLMLGFLLTIAGCGNDAKSGAGANGAEAPVESSRGGTITVGDKSWTFIPAGQCSVFPNNQVNMWGHAKADPAFEIVVDYFPDGDGPIGLAGGEYAAMGSWRTVRESMQFDINGRQVRGSGTFTVITEQGQKSVEGSFDITC